MTVDATGGIVAAPGGPTLRIPALALVDSTNITIEQSLTAAPASVSALFKFGPEGLTFARPVTVSFPVPAGVTAVSVYWTALGSTSRYEALPALISGTTVTATVTHFSQGFVGALCNAGSVCSPANPCHAAMTSCDTGAPICTDSNVNVRDGSSCDGGNVCTGGVCGAPPLNCTANVSCSFPGADPCRSYVTSCASRSATPGCSAAGNRIDGASCGVNSSCTAGVCSTQPPCSPNQPCTPIGPVNLCGDYRISCTSTTATPVCTASGTLADGTSCGAPGNACFSNACVPSRTIASTLQTFFRKDDGSLTVVAGAPAETPVAVTGILVANGSPDGYAVYPVTTDSSGHFSVRNVPFGRYFLQIDTSLAAASSGFPVPTISRTLYEATINNPDLSILVHGRADRLAATQSTTVTLSLTDSFPWISKSKDSLIITSSQGSVYVRPGRSISPAIAAGATSFSGTFDWLDPSVSSFYNSYAGTFLPDATKGDLTWLYHRTAIDVSSAAGTSTTTWRYTAEFADFPSLTIPNGGPGNLSATLKLAPQTGNFPGDFRASQFAALAPAINPAATPSGASSPPAVAVFATPFSLNYPDASLSATPLGSFFIPGAANTDVDFGTLHYGQFLGSLWPEFASGYYSYDVILTAPGAPGPVTVSELYFFSIPMSSVGTSWVPTLGPPQSPRINDTDAFTTHSTGRAPIISWSPPAFGIVTRYTVGLNLQGNPQANDVISLTAWVYTGASFRVPGTFMRTGQFYSGNVVANNASDSIDSPQLRQGYPATSIGTDFGLFGP